MGRSKMNLSHCNTEREIVRQRGKAKQREKAKEREKQRGKEEELEAEDKTDWTRKPLMTIELDQPFS